MAMHAKLVPCMPHTLPAASLGGMAGAFYATNVGATRPMGMEGWRFAFLLVSWRCCCVPHAGSCRRHTPPPRNVAALFVLVRKLNGVPAALHASQVAVISVVTAALVYRYAVDPRHLHHHPSLHGGTLGGLSRMGSGMGAGSQGWLDSSSTAAVVSAAADVEGQRPGPRPSTPLTWQQVRAADANDGGAGT